MYDFFWFSDSQRARIAPLLPTDMRGRKRPETVDDRPVPSGIVHALRCGAIAGPTAAISTGRARYMGRCLQRSGRRRGYAWTP